MLQRNKIKAVRLVNSGTIAERAEAPEYFSVGLSCPSLIFLRLRQYELTDVMKWEPVRSSAWSDPKCGTFYLRRTRQAAAECTTSFYGAAPRRLWPPGGFGTFWVRSWVGTAGCGDHMRSNLWAHPQVTSRACRDRGRTGERVGFLPGAPNGWMAEWLAVTSEGPHIHGLLLSLGSAADATSCWVFVGSSGTTAVILGRVIYRNQDDCQSWLLGERSLSESWVRVRVNITLSRLSVLVKNNWQTSHIYDNFTTTLLQTVPIKKIVCFV